MEIFYFKLGIVALCWILVLFGCWCGVQFLMFVLALASYLLLFALRWKFISLGLFGEIICWIFVWLLSNKWLNLFLSFWVQVLNWSWDSCLVLDTLFFFGCEISWVILNVVWALSMVFDMMVVICFLFLGCFLTLAAFLKINK